MSWDSAELSETDQRREESREEVSEPEEAKKSQRDEKWDMSIVRRGGTKNNEGITCAGGASQPGGNVENEASIEFVKSTLHDFGTPATRRKTETPRRSVSASRARSFVVAPFSWQNTSTLVCSMAEKIVKHRTFSKETQSTGTRCSEEVREFFRTPPIRHPTEIYEKSKRRRAEIHDIREGCRDKRLRGMGEG